MLHANYYQVNPLLEQLEVEVLNAVTCNVHFGVPGGQGDCLQIGICRVIIDAHPNVEQDRRCRKAPASLYINESGNFEMFFPIDGIMPCTERAIFKNKWFPVPVAHRLDENLMRELSAEMNPVIPMGKYPITKVQGGYVISF